MFEKWKIRFRALKWLYKAYRTQRILFPYTPHVITTWEENAEELMTEENIAALKKNIDDQSCKVLDLFLRELKFFLKLRHYDYALVYDFPFEEDKTEREKFRKEAERYKDSGLPSPLPAESLYFHHGLRSAPESVKNYIKGKIFIDGGACAGDSTLIFQQYQPGKVIAFDISPRMVKLFHSVMQKNAVPDDNYLLLQKGLGEKTETVAFDDIGVGSTTLLKNGKYNAEIVPLDSCKEITGTVGLIKFDLEGFGLQAIRGMRETIKKDRPVLALAVYHSCSELFGIKAFLEELDLKYRIEYKSCYFDHYGELTMFAYPEELERK